MPESDAPPNSPTGDPVKSAKDFRRTEATFATTRWSLVALLHDEDETKACAALTEICRIYYYPLYAYARKKGIDRFNAEDLAGGLLEDILSRGPASLNANPAAGRFRDYLKEAFDHFEANQRRHAKRQKRGGGAIHVEFDDVEERYLRDLPEFASPELLHDAIIARTLSDRAWESVRRQQDGKITAEEFNVSREKVMGGRSRETWAQIGAPFGKTEAAARQTGRRLREAFIKAFVEEVRLTVLSGDDAEVEAEVKYLIPLLADCRPLEIE